MTNMSNKGVSQVPTGRRLPPLIHRRKNEFVHSLFTYWLYSKFRLPHDTPRARWVYGAGRN